MYKKLILVLLLLTCVAAAEAVTHGWLIFETRADAVALLDRINACFPQTSQFSGKVFPYWMKTPVPLMRAVVTTNVTVDAGITTTNVVETTEQTGKFVVLIRPSVLPVLSDFEKAAVTDAVPDGCFIGEEE
jgi:hypothetical protein